MVQRVNVAIVLLRNFLRESNFSNFIHSHVRSELFNIYHQLRAKGGFKASIVIISEFLRETYCSEGLTLGPKSPIRVGGGNFGRRWACPIYACYNHD